MWPLTGQQVVNACGGLCENPALDQIVIAGVKADGAPPEPDELFVALREPAYNYDGHDWVSSYLKAGAALALVAADWPGLAMLPPALRERCIVVEDSLRAFRKLAAWLRGGFSFPVVAVGGSNGKTTTKEMIAALLSGPGFRVTKTQGNLNGFTGIPLTIAQREHAATSAPHALVAEIGIDAPLAMADHAALLAPTVAVLTALGPEHLAGLGSWEVAVAEELLLFETTAGTRRVFQARDAKVRERLGTARRGDVIVCDKEDQPAAVSALLGSASWDGRARRELWHLGISWLTFRVSCPTPLTSEIDLAWFPAAAKCAEPSWRSQLHVPMAGRHNADNLAAAFGSALALGRTPDQLLAGWPSFAPPELRCQCTALPDGGILIDDTYNASPPSMAAAFALLNSPGLRTRRKVLILGDMLGLGESSARWHDELLQPLRTLENAHVCLFGDSMRQVYLALAATPVGTSFLPPDSDPRAFLALSAVVIAGAVVLVKGSRGMRLERVVNQIRRAAVASSSHPEVEQVSWQNGGRWQLQFSDS